jgi:hypothetical protein
MPDKSVGPTGVFVLSSCLRGFVAPAFIRFAQTHGKFFRDIA